MHGNVAPVRNRILFMILSWMLGFGRSRYTPLLLAAAGFFIYIWHQHAVN